MRSFWERVAAYLWRQHWELPANILEGITLVLLVFVQDVAFKESVIVCAVLLLMSLALHGAAFKAGQCKVWPKVIELAAPIPFLAMIAPGFLATAATQKTAFITINVWFAAVEVACMLAGRNFMMEYLQDWNPQQIWGTPLLQYCATATAVVWIICQLIMAAAQGFVVAFNISINSGNLAAAVMVCYVMQLVPLLAAVIFTFAYPAWVKKQWGYVKGDPNTCYPPPTASTASAQVAPAGNVLEHQTCAGASILAGDSSSSTKSAASADLVICISPKGPGNLKAIRS